MTDVNQEECRLTGGPTYLPEQLRTTVVHVDDLKVKVDFYNGWEHFERDGEFTDTGVPTFRWSMRTKAAE